MARLYKRKNEYGLKGNDPAKHKASIGFAAPKHDGGAWREVSGGLGKRRGSIFQTSQDAHKSYAKSLKEDGYTRLSNSTFQKEGKPVLVITRPGKFGYKMKGGKGKRLMSKRGAGLIL